MIAAIELLAASQALHFREPLSCAVNCARLLEAVRAIAPPVEEDRPLSRDMEARGRGNSRGAHNVGDRRSAWVDREAPYLQGRML